MFDDIRKSIQLTLYERITSPLSGALIFSWLVWNWKIPYYLFFDNTQTPILIRFDIIERNFFNYMHNLIYPMISAIFLIIIYPFATTGTLYIWLRFKKWQSAIKNKIEDNQLLTLTQSIELRLQLRRQQDEVAILIRSKDDDISILKKENETLRSQLSQASRVQQQSRRSPSMPQLGQDAKLILSDAAADPKGLIILVENGDDTRIHINNKIFSSDGKARRKTELIHALEELTSTSLITQKEPFRYYVTHEGYKYADQIKGTA
jgi:hypothetical protein